MHWSAWGCLLSKPVLFVTVRAGTAYPKIWRLVNNFFARIIRFTVQKFQLFWLLSNLLHHYFFHWIMAHFNFVISQNAKWGHAGFYIEENAIVISVFYFSFEISIACRLLSRPNWRIVSKLTTDVVTYCTEASNQKSKYAYRKIFLYKKALLLTEQSLYNDAYV